MTIVGAGGGGGGKGGGGGSSRTPSSAPDSLDSRQYANVIDLISEGEIEGLVDGFKSVYLNNTPLQNPDGSYNFQDVEIYTRNGTQTQTYIPLNPGVEDEKPVGVNVVNGLPITRTITDVDVDAVRVTISIPSLQNINPSNGDTSGASITLKISVQYGGGGFTDVITDTISGRTADEYRKDYLIELNRPNPANSVDIRVTRVTPDSTTSLLSNAFSWSSYTEIIWAKLRYPNSALIGLRVDAEQFSSIPSRAYLVKGIKVRIPAGVTVDVDTGRIIYPSNFIWDGTFGAATWTSCPSWILWDLLTSTRYGFGQHVDTAQLDKYAFYRASRYANELVSDGYGGQEARFSCNTTIQTAEEAYKLINDLLSVMRCQGFWSVGTMTIAQDRPEDPVALFTLANVDPDGFSYSGSSLKTRPNVAVVSYLDLSLRDTAYEIVEDQDAIDKYGVVRTEISAFACTSRGQANRIGRWLLYSERYEKEVVAFKPLPAAGLSLRPGQIIEIADPVKAGARRAGRIAAATTTTVTVDNTTDTDLTPDPGATLSVILPDGSMETRQISTIVADVVTVQDAYSAAPNPNSLWMIESPTLEASRWRVLGITEEEGINYSVTALAHNPSKYAYVENGEPLTTLDTTNLNVVPPSPTDLEILSVPIIGGGTSYETQYDLNGRIAIKITFHWLGPTGIKRFRVKYRFEDDNFTTTTVQGTTFTIEDAKPGNYQIQVSSVNASGILFSEPALASYTVLGISAPPVDVSGLSMVPISESLAVLTWTQAPDLDVRVGGKVIIRHDPRPITSAEWASSTQIVDAVAGSSTQKQVPLLPGTYFVKFEDYAGNRSVNATGFEVRLPQYETRLELDLYVALDYVADYYYSGVQWQEQLLSTPFSGTRINCAYNGTETALVISGSLYVADLYWDKIYCEGDLAAEYYFAETLDMGATYDVNFRRYVLVRAISTGILFDAATDIFDSRSGFFDGTSVDAINLITYIRATSDDPTASPVWGPWTELINGVVQGRAFQMKALLITTSDSVNIAVEELQVIPELVGRTATSSSPNTATAVTFDAAFYDLNSVNITPIALNTGERFVLSDVNRTGFSINFYQNSTPLEKAYTYSATGYGRAI